PTGSTLFPYTTLFRSGGELGAIEIRLPQGIDDQRLEAVALAATLFAAVGDPLAQRLQRRHLAVIECEVLGRCGDRIAILHRVRVDRKSTRLNSSHVKI